MKGKVYKGHALPAPTKSTVTRGYAACFGDFLDETPADKPWFFWVGSVDPHRKYPYGSGVAVGNKKFSDIDDLPRFFPKNEIVRGRLIFPCRRSSEDFKERLPVSVFPKI